MGQPTRSKYAFTKFKSTRQYACRQLPDGLGCEVPGDAPDAGEMSAPRRIAGTTRGADVWEDVMNVRTLVPLFAAGLIGSATTLGLDRVAGWQVNAQALPSVMQAQRFELVDANGSVRGVFGLSDSGPNLVLMDPSGLVRLSLDQTLESTYEIQIKDKSGAVRFGVGTTPREGGFVGLHVRDGSGAIRARLFASDDGQQTGFQVQDPGARLRAEMALNAGDDRVGFSVRDSGGTTLWQAP